MEPEIPTVFTNSYISHVANSLAPKQKLVLPAALQWRDREFAANHRAALDRAFLDVQTKDRLTANLPAGL
jgi:hypothetical protein